MSNASDICAARIIRTNAEGFRADAYDDATGEPVHAQGVITVGYGCACRQWSERFARAVLSFQLAEVETELIGRPWYVGCNDARRSALLEIAFNQGDAGLIRGYPHLIAAVSTENWPQAQAQCGVRDPRLKARYDRLGQILLTGVDA